MRADTLFPSTHATWITVQLDAVDRGDHASADRALRELRDHVMRRYYEPLSAYLSATGYRDVDAPSALVAGYFVERFADAASLAKWRESGLPLRRWLMNGLLLWVRAELRRRRTQAGRESALPAEIMGESPTAEAAFDREWARSIVSEACELVALELETEGASGRWSLFRRHVFDGQSYEEIALQHACDVRTVRNACRVVRSRLDSSIRRLLRDEGIRGDALDDELARIQSLFRGRGET
jgi:DNA-directed RNA polymerase specialized sigma24 family protein